MAGERRQPGSPGGGTAGALLDLLGRALGLEGAALLVERPGLVMEPVATFGPAPLPRAPVATDASWTHRLPLGDGAARGLLLIARESAAPLPHREQALAEEVAHVALGVADNDRLATELRHTRTLLARADRLSALGLLTAGLTHEIRNPLVSVRTFVELLPERLDDREFLTSFRELALSEIERICSLLNDLLAFSRPTPAERVPGDLNALVGQVVRLLDIEARRDDVSLDLGLAPALPTVVMDESQMKQVLMNVILNAVQATGAHGHVEIATGTGGDSPARRCLVTVADAGPGIASEHLDHIFDPFFSTKDSGSGLGLYIARQIVTSHGGRILAAPRPNGGTVFSIDLPATDEHG